MDALSSPRDELSTPVISAVTTAPAEPGAALERAVEHLLSLQDADGWWKGELETNVTMDAEDMLLREFLGIREPEATARSARWIRSQQRDDGTWSNFYGGPANLSTTIESYVALRLAGDSPTARHMRAAAEYIRGAGGLQRARVFTHIWLALFGAWPWTQVPALPTEVILLPSWLPLNVYDFACWARQTVVALSVVLARRPVRPLPFTLEELDGPEPFSPPTGSSWFGRGLVALDRLLQAYERRPLAPLRRFALNRAERWIVDRQEADGGWGGIQPPWVYSLIALHLVGYELDHPVMVRGLAGMQSFTIDDDLRRVEACQSPIWDTCLSLIALRDGGLAGDHEAVIRGADWLLDQQILQRGDWAVRRPEIKPGGWAFEFANANYPDVDDTAEVVLALNTVLHPDPERVQTAIDLGVRWLEGMRSSDDGWGAFDVDNCRSLLRDLPFCDFGEVIDPPSADVTAHVVEMLGALGRTDDQLTTGGVRWLLDNQEQDGSWFGRWGVNHVYGTGAVLPALIAAGVSPSGSPIRRAVRWLEQHQNDDGGWGEDCRSYDDPTWIGRGESTPSQTAWALLALDAADQRDSPATRRGVDWLVVNQRADGGWDEDFHTGTGFPGDFYIKYHLYRLVFPIMALGRCAR
ncbi:MAG TPA: squalene--hopene cyclase [Solirubrobacteraceae bacterium]|jgi:squalene-hopene/tetraprenyl-beta-curcumene cyclase|nr:squalene--hopene cyclase [Solirubrobacteraceae bacterium]